MHWFAADMLAARREAEERLAAVAMGVMLACYMVWSPYLALPSLFPSSRPPLPPLLCLSLALSPPSPPLPLSPLSLSSPPPLLSSPLPRPLKSKMTGASFQKLSGCDSGSSHAKKTKSEARVHFESSGWVSLGGLGSTRAGAMLPSRHPEHTFNVCIVFCTR